MDQAHLDRIVKTLIEAHCDSPEFDKAVADLNAIPDDRIRKLAFEAVLDYRDKDDYPQIKH